MEFVSVLNMRCFATCVYSTVKVIPARVVEKPAFVAVQDQASVQQVSEVEHEQFDKWFDRCPWIWALERAQFAAWQETERLEHSDLKHLKQKQTYKTHSITNSSIIVRWDELIIVICMVKLTPQCDTKLTYLEIKWDPSESAHQSFKLATLV